LKKGLKSGLRKGQKGSKRAKKGQKGPKRAKKGQKGPKRAKKGSKMALLPIFLLSGGPGGPRGPKSPKVDSCRS
jgi:hypothetical protein